ncbi:hypothetical protein DJ69_10900 [Halorubrum persicum]|uniref:Uncharacterized protein n=1 Tax=Halorubrum persicum TaxID=1383844 RepID=A0A2G1WHR3_9EURY|nr:hypothetical protein DJ69_10900 [Halorubrum persicum]
MMYAFHLGFEILEAHLKFRYFLILVFFKLFSYCFYNPHLSLIERFELAAILYNMPQIGRSTVKISDFCFRSYRRQRF